MLSFKIQGRDFGFLVASIKRKLVRTYKGEIKRNQLGKVAAFPLSFITVGFDVKFQGDRQTVKAAEQLLLSSDTVEIETSYDGTPLKGAFSCTTNSYDEVMNKGETDAMLSVSVVSDGTDIVKPTGVGYDIIVDGVIRSTKVPYGKVVNLSAAYKKGGATLPRGMLLVLGDENLTSS